MTVTAHLRSLSTNMQMTQPSPILGVLINSVVRVRKSVMGCSPLPSFTSRSQKQRNCSQHKPNLPPSVSNQHTTDIGKVVNNNNFQSSVNKKAAQVHLLCHTVIHQFTLCGTICFCTSSVSQTERS